MSLLDYDTQTLHSRDYSYQHEFANLEREGWEIDPTMHAGDTVYLRRHPRIPEIQTLAARKLKHLCFHRTANGTWTATFFPPLQPESENEPQFEGETAREAAEMAWAHLSSDKPTKPSTPPQRPITGRPLVSAHSRSRSPRLPARLA